MNKYKWLNESKTVVAKYSTVVAEVNQPSDTTIVEGGRGWVEFQEYLAAGGQVDPWKTPEEILDESLIYKLAELETEFNSRVDIATGTTSSRKKSKIISRMVKLSRKESQGRASQNEVDELDLMEGLDDYLDDLDSTNDDAEQFLEGSILEVIENYNVQVDPNWPVYGG